VPKARLLLSLALLAGLAIVSASSAQPPSGRMVVAVVEPSLTCAFPKPPGTEPPFPPRGSSYHCNFAGSATTSFGRARASGRVDMKTSGSGITTVQGTLTLDYGLPTGKTTISLLTATAATSSTVVDVESPPGNWQLGSGSGLWFRTTGNGTYLFSVAFGADTKMAIHLEGSVKRPSR
jgi:hypothetical protein